MSTSSCVPERGPKLPCLRQAIFERQRTLPPGLAKTNEFSLGIRTWLSAGRRCDIDRDIVSGTHLGRAVQEWPEFPHTKGKRPADRRVYLSGQVCTLANDYCCIHRLEQFAKNRFQTSRQLLRVHSIRRTAPCSRVHFYGTPLKRPGEPARQ